jgi:hypothetical protein
VKRPGVASEASRASPAKWGKRQEYIDVLPHRQSLQNKQCFHNHHMHTCLLRATLSTPAPWSPQKDTTWPVRKKMHRRDCRLLFADPLSSIVSLACLGRGSAFDNDAGNGLAFQVERFGQGAYYTAISPMEKMPHAQPVTHSKTVLHFVEAGSK